MSNSPIRRYTAILTELMNRADNAALSFATKEFVWPGIEAFREQAAKQFEEETDEFVTSLPDETEGGAIVSLKTYARMNRDDIIRRMRLGKYARVEEVASALADS